MPAPPPPPPPGPPPPPTLALANTQKPNLNRSEQQGRNALLTDICKGARLKKAVTNDRSAPVLRNPNQEVVEEDQGEVVVVVEEGSRDTTDSAPSRGPILPPGGRPSGPASFGSGGGLSGPPKIPGASSSLRNNAPELPKGRPNFSRQDSPGGPPPVPNTPRPNQNPSSRPGPPSLPSGPRPTPSSGPAPPPGRHGPLPPPPMGSRTSHSAPPPPMPNGTRPHLPPGGRPPLPDERPPPPPAPVGQSRPSMPRDVPPPPPSVNSKPSPVSLSPSPRSSAAGGAPPLPPGRPGPPPLPPTPPVGDDHNTPRLPQRNTSLNSHSSAPPHRSGPLPPPPNERPPSLGRSPSSVRSGPLPPPPPSSRSGGSIRSSAAPPPVGRPGPESPRSGLGGRPPLPPDRPGQGHLYHLHQWAMDFKTLITCRMNGSVVSISTQCQIFHHLNLLCRVRRRIQVDWSRMKPRGQYDLCILAPLEVKTQHQTTIQQDQAVV
ncbi:hypothetical protein WMY93_007266 [Mugilogobius chulae]|uniref:WH2 domain-containing protein n=1 Tax=Mugilogobius chulae TaxID=88201 RepID=A0AAW0PQU6_9GOBI